MLAKASLGGVCRLRAAGLLLPGPRDAHRAAHERMTIAGFLFLSQTREDAARPGMFTAVCRPRPSPVQMNAQPQRKKPVADPRTLPDTYGYTPLQLAQVGYRSSCLSGYEICYGSRMSVKLEQPFCCSSQLREGLLSCRCRAEPAQQPPTATCGRQSRGRHGRTGVTCGVFCDACVL
jgi:hypothetical protein